jgi:hypothetical protein
MTRATFTNAPSTFPDAGQRAEERYEKYQGCSENDLGTRVDAKPDNEQRRERDPGNTVERYEKWIKDVRESGNEWTHVSIGFQVCPGFQFCMPNNRPRHIERLRRCDVLLQNFTRGPHQSGRYRP